MIYNEKVVKYIVPLFWTCWRIQHEAEEAAGRDIPLVVENVCGAQKWIGPAVTHYGSFYLWGDLPAIMPDVPHRKGFAREWRDSPNGMPMMPSKSRARKAASAQIAKIPFALAQHIARAYKP